MALYRKKPVVIEAEQFTEASKGRREAFQLALKMRAWAKRKVAD